jgi:glycosyltransferase involved in cell wall biosynthesis
VEEDAMKALAITLAKRSWVTGVWTFLEVTKRVLEREGIDYLLPDHWLNRREPRRPLRALVKAYSWLTGTSREINIRRMLIGPALSGIARRESRFHNPDVLHIQGSLAAGLILDFLAEERVPWVLHLHSIDSELIRAEGLEDDHPLVIFSDYLLKKSIKSAPVACAVSWNLRERLAALGADVSRIRVVHNTILVPELPQLPPREPYVFLPARLSPEKGVDVALSAWEEVEKRNPRVWLCIAGTGPQEGALRRFVQDRGLRNVRFLGMLSFEETMAWAAGALLLLQPTVPRGGFREAFGMTALEAMVLGVPVVSSDTGAGPEVLGDAGIHVPPFDAEAMSNAIARLLADEGLRRELGQRGLERARELFGPETYAKKMSEAFSDAIEGFR